MNDMPGRSKCPLASPGRTFHYRGTLSAGGLTPCPPFRGGTEHSHKFVYVLCDGLRVDGIYSQ